MINLQWGTKKNGQIPTIMLVDVSGRGDYMEPTAAAQFKRMQAAIRRDVGFDLQPAPGSSAYRPEATQIEFFTERYTKVSYNTGLWWNGSYWKKNAGAAVAAIPATSNHGWARAIDLNISRLDTEAWEWMLEHAAEYGLSWATGKASGEDWHWECLTPPGTAVAGLSASLITDPTSKEIDMKSNYLVKGAVGTTMGPLNGILAVVGPQLFTALGSQSDFDGIARDVHEDSGSILAGYDPEGAGVQYSELVRLVTVFGIEPGYVGPGGRYYGPGHPLNKRAKPSL